MQGARGRTHHGHQQFGLLITDEGGQLTGQGFAFGRHRASQQLAHGARATRPTLPAPRTRRHADGPIVVPSRPTTPPLARGRRRHGALRRRA